MAFSSYAPAAVKRHYPLEVLRSRGDRTFSSSPWFYQTYLAVESYLETLVMR